MTETDQPQPQPQPVNSIVATDHAIHIRLGRLALMIQGINEPDSETVVIDEALYPPLYEVLAREIVKRDEAGGAWPPRFHEEPPTDARLMQAALTRLEEQAAAISKSHGTRLVRLEDGEQLPPQMREIGARLEQLPPQIAGIGARLEVLENDLQRLRSNIESNLTVRINRLADDVTSSRAQQGRQVDVNDDTNKSITDLSSAVATLRKQLEQAAPPELASLVELVTGQQDQIDKLQAMFEPRIPAGGVDGRPVAGPEIGIALDGEIARAIDRHDLATRTHVDEAIRRLAATIRQYVRDQVQQALRRRPSALRRVWDALADRGAPSAPASAPEPAAVPPAIAEMAEQALRRGR